METTEPITRKELEAATEALSKAFDQGWERHYCDEWTDKGDYCEQCWDIAQTVLIAARNAR